MMMMMSSWWRSSFTIAVAFGLIVSQVVVIAVGEVRVEKKKSLPS